MRPSPHDAATRALAWLADPAPEGRAGFGHDVAAAGTPLVGPDPDDRRRRLATFVWCADRPLRTVYARLNRVTDKDRVDAGLMTRVRDTDVWTVTLSLPADLRCSYQLCPVPEDAAAEVLDGIGDRSPTLPMLLDPLAREGTSPAGDVRCSVLALDEAPPQLEWDAPTVRGTVRTTDAVAAGRRRPTWSYVPSDVAVTEPLGLVVVPDGEVWFDALCLPAALEHAVAAGRMRPFAALGIGNLDVADRVATLGGRSELVGDLADRLVPAFRAAHPDQAWAGPEATVLCGQSLGGLTALVAALEAPGTFGHALSHSPSMWWRPDGAPTPRGLTDDAPSWVVDRVAAADVTTSAVRIDVGSLEGATVAQTARLHEVLGDRGWTTSRQVYAGGHDVAWWRGALLDGLATVPH